MQIEHLSIFLEIPHLPSNRAVQKIISKMDRGIRHSILSEIKKWVTDGLLEKENADVIQSRYDFDFISSPKAAQQTEIAPVSIASNARPPFSKTAHAAAFTAIPLSQVEITKGFTGGGVNALLLLNDKADIPNELILRKCLRFTFFILKIGKLPVQTGVHCEFNLKIILKK